MKKNTVDNFDLAAAFKALNELSVPNAKKGIAKNKRNINLKEYYRGNKQTDLLLEDYYDVNDMDELEAAQEIRDAEIAKAKLARIEKIVDLDAASEEELLNSYAGKLIIQCPQCMTLFYKNKEDVAPSEEDPDIVNVEEICQHCGNADGYTLIGKVAEVAEDEVSQPEEATGEETSDEVAVDETEETSEEEVLPDEETEEEATEETEIELPEVELEDSEEEEEEIKEESLISNNILKRALKTNKLAPSYKKYDACTTLVEDFEEEEVEVLEGFFSDGGKFDRLLDKPISKLIRVLAKQNKELCVNAFKSIESKIGCPAEEIVERILDGQNLMDIFDECNKLDEGFAKTLVETRIGSFLKKAFGKAKDTVINAAKTAGRGVKKLLSDPEKLDQYFGNNEGAKFGKGYITIALKTDDSAYINQVKSSNKNDFVMSAEPVKYNKVINTGKVGKEAKFESNKSLDARTYNDAEETFEALKADPDYNIVIMGTVFYPNSLGQSAPADESDKNGIIKVGIPLKIAVDQKEILDSTYRVLDIYMDAKNKADDDEKARKNSRERVEWKEYQPYGYKKGVKFELKYSETGAEDDAHPFEGNDLIKIDGSLKLGDVITQAKKAGANLAKGTIFISGKINEDKTVLIAKINAGGKESKDTPDLIKSFMDKMGKTESISFKINKLTQLDEATFTKHVNRYLTEVYENVKSFVATDCILNNNKLIVEGNINYVSGNTANTKFMFKVRKLAESRIAFIGANKMFSNKPCFILEGVLTNKGTYLITENFKYKYYIGKDLVEGLTKTDRKTKILESKKK